MESESSWIDDAINRLSYDSVPGRVGETDTLRSRRITGTRIRSVKMVFLACVVMSDFIVFRVYRALRRFVLRHFCMQFLDIFYQKFGGHGC